MNLKQNFINKMKHPILCFVSSHDQAMVATLLDNADTIILNARNNELKLEVTMKPYGSRFTYAFDESLYSDAWEKMVQFFIERMGGLRVADGKGGAFDLIDVGGMDGYHPYIPFDLTDPELEWFAITVDSRNELEVYVMDEASDVTMQIVGWTDD